ncbi:histidine phosphatase family protein [Asticcacaulis sp. EMRT-3]|uniref:SixA phosphatase family protein n=1 Tax=Asticcacaulis sp. EMRT-3 TaxID=3040349 RepID=UPI0024AEE0B6|nr:histidine phosphatase family protein [Asticcacaulis sp. EMRT-3]MDI7773793.1 histidine phosphatase family protein [Asticcacaulis sp. EMRT-3]
MKQLILMRHAQAEKKAKSGEDFDRNLSAHGREEAASVARALKAYGVKPDFALVSAAQRTQDTFREIEAVLGEIPALISKDFYNAGAESLRRAIERHESDGQCLLVVAHNPGVQYLVADYLFEGAAGPEIVGRVQGNYPTATATVFEVDVAGRPVYDGIYLAKDVAGA